MKTRIMLKLDAELLRRVRIVAAQEDQSLSSLITRQLEALVHRRDAKAYEVDRKRALSRLSKGFHLNWTRPRSRDEVHKR